MTAPAATEPADLPMGEARLAEWAGPELLVAAEALLPSLLRQVRSGGYLEPAEADQLEVDVNTLELAILKATIPWEDLSEEQQAAILDRFPPFNVEDIQHA